MKRRWVVIQRRQDRGLPRIGRRGGSGGSNTHCRILLSVQICASFTGLPIFMNRRHLHEPMPSRTHCFSGVLGCDQFPSQPLVLRGQLFVGRFQSFDYYSVVHNLILIPDAPGRQ
jgi:hypothetical protein